eukprot:NODE_5274_length_1788_cov_9.800120.p1 GENE.NODE_5274_length_1788_cov_9.800120~~NODE_5274_length_1788_cov_9.800120.p1  ORF type:complete len:420 (+),score=82.52 NODE_5274_length_1788_cov_9.800120:145-1404(+)
MPLDSFNLDTRSYTVQATQFDIPKQYSLLELVGAGANGVVCAAVDEITGEDVAIKKIVSAFEHITYTKRTLRELRILRHLTHENVVDIRQIFMPGCKADFRDIYVVTELMETDLSLIIKSHQPLLDDHSQFFLYQIMRGMKYVHSAQVIHRDLKPRNLLVNANCDLKICDFGLARVTFQGKHHQACLMTEYVCTRWYRAPEVLCSWKTYTSAVDVWSIGCILAEMLKRTALFPGTSTAHQLNLIIGVLGTQTGEERQKIPNSNCQRFLTSLPHTTGRKFEDVFPNAPPEAIDLLSSMLQFNPDNRTTVSEALDHPYLSQFSSPEDEPEGYPLDPNEYEFERREVTIDALREELFHEAMLYYPDKIESYLEGKRYDIRELDLLNPDKSPHDDIVEEDIVDDGNGDDDEEDNDGDDDDDDE